MTKAKTKAKEQDAEALLFTPPEEQGKPSLPAKVDPKPKTPARAREEPARVVPIADPLQIMAVIERLATNPTVDPEKLERLLALQERLLDRNAKTAFDDALGRVIPALPVITRDGKIIVQEKTATGKRDGAVTQNTPYAKWETIMPIVNPILAEHGLHIRHRIGTAADGRVRVTALLSGYGYTDDSCYFDLPADTTGSKNNAQAWASAVSYAKRHTACAVLNIVTRQEDDDGKGSGRPVVMGEPIDVDQAARIRDFAEAVGCKVERLISHLNKTRPKGHPEMEKLDDLPVARFDAAIDALRGYEANAKKLAEEKAKGGQQ